ncbi:hypothetical protein B0T18DRAFT_411163 [Schizothecium vesticola]|uniref:Uncharacterized protein n=1 Tax=Schizothecium vesticola TaxID=314040 RepID=A0AA40K537_9PEZI|nr:hypothetical protein B0T18DRAFT_411163 [Schizothecium vesticola]
MHTTSPPSHESATALTLSFPPPAPRQALDLKAWPPSSSLRASGWIFRPLRYPLYVRIYRYYSLIPSF